MYTVGLLFIFFLLSHVPVKGTVNKSSISDPIRSHQTYIPVYTKPAAMPPPFFAQLNILPARVDRLPVCFYTIVWDPLARQADEIDKLSVTNLTEVASQRSARKFVRFYAGFCRADKKCGVF